MKKHLHTVQLPVSERLQILDVGFGTGKWADDVAQRYATAQVTAVDIFPSQIPEPEDNLNTISPIDFTESRWGNLRDNSFHLAHLSQLCGSVPDWDRLYATVFK